MAQIDEILGVYFRSDSRSGGARLHAQGRVSLSGASDTQARAYVKGASPIRVGLFSEDIGDELLSVECTCPAFKRSQLCKHIWAALLSLEQEHPDFLECKKVIQKSSSPRNDSSARASKPEQPVHSERVAELQAKAKLRAKEYRKAQYERQKQRVKDLKNRRRGEGLKPEPSPLPPPVVQALSYFELNGFAMPSGPSEAVIAEARKKLARVFHPDKGGSNHEMVELNKYCDFLLRWLGS